MRTSITRWVFRAYPAEPGREIGPSLKVVEGSLLVIREQRKALIPLKSTKIHGPRPYNPEPVHIKDSQRFRAPRVP